MHLPQRIAIGASEGGIFLETNIDDGGQTRPPLQMDIPIQALLASMLGASMYNIAAVPPAGPPRPTHSDLFLAFLRITLSSIGGALPWTRRWFIAAAGLAALAGLVI